MKTGIVTGFTVLLLACNPGSDEAATDNTGMQEQDTVNAMMNQDTNAGSSTNAPDNTQALPAAPGADSSKATHPL